MPELPEIAHFRKFADEAFLNKKVQKITFGAAKPLQQPEAKFREAFEKHSFTRSHQLGKYLFFESDSKKWLVFHFGMTGHFDFSSEKELPKHSILTFYFGDHTHFSFVCPRKFGKVWITGSVEEFKNSHNLGDDATKIKKSDFMDLMDKNTSAIKSFLMDQHNIAGIGNVYTDEILFQSRIHPQTKVSALSDKEKGALFENIGKILITATKFIDKGEKAPDSWLKRHRKEEADCPECHGKVSKTTVGGRSTYYCGECQKLEK